MEMQVIWIKLHSFNVVTAAAAASTDVTDYSSLHSRSFDHFVRSLFTIRFVVCVTRKNVKPKWKTRKRKNWIYETASWAFRDACCWWCLLLLLLLSIGRMIHVKDNTEKHLLNVLEVDAQRISSPYFRYDECVSYQQQHKQRKHIVHMQNAWEITFECIRMCTMKNVLVQMWDIR